jgi:uncharacterized protein (DUF433 family)
MMSVESIVHEIGNLSAAEKAEVLQTLLYTLTDVWPGIEKTPGIIGGDACIVRTRIPVWALEQYRRIGWTEAEILQNYPTLRAVDLAQAWAYAAAHPDEIERALREQANA